jgi:hypothetical protein
MSETQRASHLLANILEPSQKLGTGELYCIELYFKVYYRVIIIYNFSITKL